MAGKSAAIRADDLDGTTLDKMSATQFVEALTARKAVGNLKYWPEKKKYELEVEPGTYGKLPFGTFVDILEGIRGEKKKVEYEVPDWLRWRVNPSDLVAGVQPQPQPSVAGRLDEMAERVRELTAKVERLHGK